MVSLDLEFVHGSVAICRVTHWRLANTTAIPQQARELRGFLVKIVFVYSFDFVKISRAHTNIVLDHEPG